MKYLVCMCPSCGWIQVITSAKSLSCRQCGKSTILHQKNKFGYAVKTFGSFENPHDAMICCAKARTEKVYK